MPKLSPEELKRARIAKKKVREEEIAQRLKAAQEAAEKRKMEEISMANQRKQAQDKAMEQKARCNQLASETETLYQEMDKLNKKAPGMTISELSLKKINKIIKSVKELVMEDHDEFMDDIEEFIPAGDMPEYRDVTLVLGEVKSGLERYKNRHDRTWRDLLGVF